MNDGTLKFDTSIDPDGFQKGINTITDAAQKGLQATSAILKASVTAISGLGIAAVKVGSDFESAMSKVEAISGATGDDLEALKNKAKEMGASTKFSATESANAFEYMAMAGWKTADMLSGIEGIMNLAAASGEDLATTSDIVTDALTAFGMSAADSGHFADILAAASSNANTNVGMMGETFKYIAPVAGALGYSAEDTALAIGLMANSGIKASQAGTSLRGALTRLVKPTDDMQSTMVKLGLAMEKTEHVVDNSKIDKLQGSLADKTAAMEKAQSKYNTAVAKYGADSTQAQKAAASLEKAQKKLAETSDSLSKAQAGSNKVVGVQNTLMTDGTGKMRSFKDVMIQLRQSFKGMTEEQQAQAAATLFGQEAMSGMLAIINASDEDFEKLAGSIDDCNGSAAEMAEIMNDNLQGQITILKSGLEGLGISFYESVQDPLKDIAKEAQGFVQQLQDAFNENGLSGMVTAFGDVLAQVVEEVAESAPDLVNAATGLISAFCESLKSSTGIGDAAASLISSLVTAFYTCADDIWTTAVVLIGKMAEGIAEGAPEAVSAMMNAILDIVECIADWLPDVAQAGIDVILALVDGIASSLPTLISYAADILVELCDAIVENLPAMTDAAISIIQALVDGLISGLPTLLEGAILLLMGIVDAIPVIIDQILQALPDLITTIVEFLAENIPFIANGAVQLLMGIIDAIPEIINALVENLPTIIIAIVGALINATPQIVEAAVTLFFGIIAAIPQIVAALVTAVPEIVVAIVDTIVGCGSMLVDVGASIIGWIVDGVSSVWGNVANWFANEVPVLIDNIKAFFDELPAKIGYAIGNVLGTLTKWGIDIGNWIVTEVPRIIDNIVNWFSTLPDRISEWFNQTVDNLMQWGSSFREKAGQKVSEICEGISEGFRNLPDKLMEIGGNLVRGLIDGIAGRAQELWGSITDFCNGIVSGFKDALGIHSPSTVMEEQAGYLVDGVENGIADMPNRALEVMKNLSAGVSSWGAEMASIGLRVATEFAQIIVKAIQEMPPKIGTILTNVVNRIVQWGVKLASAASTAAQNAVNKVIEWFRQLPDKVWTWLSNTLAKVTQFAAELKAKASEAAKGFVDNLVNGVKGLPDKFKEIGSNIVTGIWDGISSGWNWLTDKVKSLADSLIKAAKEALDINSPSRVFSQEVGRWIPPGIGNGIEKAMPDLQKQVDSEMEKLAARMQMAVAVETGGITVRTRAKAEHDADKDYPKGGGDTYFDQHVEQVNNYHVPVASPAETSKAQREAARKLLGGVK